MNNNKSKIFSFAFMTIDVNDKMSPDVFGGSAGSDFYKMSPIFSCYQFLLFFTQVAQKRLQSWSNFPFTPCIPPLPVMQHTTPSSPSHSWSASKKSALKWALLIKISLKYSTASKWNHISRAQIWWGMSIRYSMLMYKLI
jgi:hypothetical protein